MELCVGIKQNTAIYLVFRLLAQRLSEFVNLGQIAICLETLHIGLGFGSFASGTFGSVGKVPANKL